MNQGTIGGYWPLYEDGTPVRIGDVVEAHGVPMKVRSVDVCAPDTVLFGDLAHLRLEPGERVKRVGDAPEDVPCLCRDPDGGVGTTCVPSDEPNWHIVIDGVRYGVSSHARRAIAEALDLTTGRQTLPSGIAWPEVDGEPVVPGDVLWDCYGHRHEVSEVKFTAEFPSGAVEIDAVDRWWAIDELSLTRTEPEPVLDRDGVPIEVGDTVYNVAGIGREVEGFDIAGGKTRVRGIHRNTGTTMWCDPEDLTHQRPDSWERLKNDAQKELNDYWSCWGIKCSDCPAKVDGKTPMDRYGTAGCGLAMRADIVARAKALAGVVGDE